MKSNLRQQPKITESTISVILPTRGRRDVLITSIKSLVDKASNPARLEIIFGVDEDDTGINEFTTILFWFSLTILSYSLFLKYNEN